MKNNCTSSWLFTKNAAQCLSGGFGSSTNRYISISRLANAVNTDQGQRTVCSYMQVWHILDFKISPCSVLLCNSPASEFYMPTFRNTLFHLYKHLPMKMEQSVPKRWNIKFRHRGITQKRTYNKCGIINCRITII